MEFNISLYWYKGAEKDKLNVVGVLGSSSKEIIFEPLTWTK